MLQNLVSHISGVIGQSRMERELKENNEKFTSLLVAISSTFSGSTTDNLSQDLYSALAKIGQFVSADRSYVFMFSDDKMTMTNTHEWCAEGIEPQIENLQDLSVDIFPWWMEKLKRFENIYIPKVVDLPPEAQAEKKILEEQGIQSLLVVPLISSGILVGFFGLDSVRSLKTWSEDEIVLLKLIGDSMAHAIERINMLEKEYRNKQILEESQKIAQLGSWELDIVNNNLQWTDEVSRIFGLSPDEMENNYESFLNRIHPDDRLMVDQAYNESVKNKTPYKIVPRVLMTDGTVKYVKVRCVTYYDEAGRGIRSVGTVQDITESQKAAEEIKISKEFSQNLINSSLDMIISLDNKRRITEFNPAAEKAFGHKKEEILGKHTNSLLVNPRDGLNAYKQTVRNGRNIQEILTKRKNGDVFPSLMSASVLTDSKGERIGVMGIFRDISKRKQWEKTLMREGKKLTDIVENVSEGILIITKKGSIKYINPMASYLFGRTMDDLIGSPFGYPVVTDETSEIDLIRSDGVSLTVEMRTGLINWEGEDCILATLRDITDRKRVENEREKALEKARKSDRIKSLFLANISHEIRTPLNAILGFTDIVREKLGGQLSKEDQSFFKMIKSGSDRLLRTISQIMDMSQIEANTFSIERKRIHLVDISSNVVNEYLPAARSKNIELHHVVEDKDIFIEADEYCLYQSLKNLVDNAIKFTDRGCVRVEHKRKNGYHCLEVIDTGAGMSEQYIDMLYEIFSQESTGYSKKYQGLGLGLALTKRYLDMNDIKISVESEKGVGSVFSLLYIPLEKSLVESPEEVSIKAPVISKEMGKECPTILVVEDDINCQKLASHVLQKFYKTICTKSVWESKKLLRTNSVSAILLDLSLEGDENGLALVKHIQDSGKKEWLELPVIAVTAHALKTDMDKCLNAGCDDFISKPFQAKQLLATMKKHLGN